MKKYIILIMLITILLFIRLSIIFFSIDTVYYWPELFRGTIAKDLISGPMLPLFEYQHASYEGGSLVTGVLVVPFFLLFGETLVSLKLVALSFLVLILIFLYLFLNKYFNRSVAILAGTLFIFAPKNFTIASSVSLGAYWEAALFTILILFIFYEIFFNKEKYTNNFKKKYLLFFLFGLIGGIATYFDYIFLITLLTCLFFWFIFDSRFFLRKYFLIFLVSFSIGFSPGIFYNITHQFKGINIHGLPFYSHVLKQNIFQSFIKLKDIIVYQLRDFWYFENKIFPIWHFLSRLYYIIFILSFLFLLWSNRRSILRLMRGIIPFGKNKITPQEISRETFFLIFPLFFCIIYSLTTLYKLKYLFNLYPVMVAIIALALNKLWHHTRDASMLFTITLIAVGLGGNISLISTDEFGKGLKHKGYFYRTLGINTGWNCRGDVHLLERIIKEVPKKHRYYFYEGLGWGIDWTHHHGHYEFGGNVNKFENLINRVNKEYRPFSYIGLGWSIRCQFENEPLKLNNLLEKVDKKYIPYVYEGLSWDSVNSYINIQKELSIAENLNSIYLPYYYKGLGKKIGWFEGFQNDSFSFINKIDGKYKSYVYIGLGWSFGERFEENPNRYLQLMGKVPKEYRRYVYEGLGWGLGWRFGENRNEYDALINRIDEDYRIYCYQGLELYLRERAGEGFLLIND